MVRSIQIWFKSGLPWVWVSASAVTISVLMVAALLGLIAARGAGHFWPSDVIVANYQQVPSAPLDTIIGEVTGSEPVSASRLLEAGIEIPEEGETFERILIKMGNRKLTGQDFRWVVDFQLSNIGTPREALVLERRSWGNFYGFLYSIKQSGKRVAEGPDAWEMLEQYIARANTLHKQIREIETDQIGKINYRMEKLRLRERKLQIDGTDSSETIDPIHAERNSLQRQYETLQTSLGSLYRDIQRDSLIVQIGNGSQVEIKFADVIRAYQPNSMKFADKGWFYLQKLWEFISTEPREANTEGGILPSIFGTVMMVILMSVVVTPFGVIAAVYLREYARQGALTRLIRISVNNLAGVPSIVYGVFGLGFFVYFLGGSIDQLFYPEVLPAPTFGTPGILWASLTLALLTVPVVIVSTEEGLSRIPKSIREGSLALGATKAETLWRTVIPMASPSIMTGIILAIARAAGEVAPLMLVGVVKLAPSLPVDGNFPFLHLERKFMHLGFHIYDVGFQSPNVEAARPIVFATSLLLVIVIVGLNLTAITIRNRLREKYHTLEN